EAAVVAFAHGGVHADVGGDAGGHHVADAARTQDEFEVGGAEGTLARLVDDDLALDRRKFLDDFPARLAAHQDLAAGTFVADADAVGADLARAPALVVGQVGKVGAVALARVDDVEAFASHFFQELFNRSNRRPRQGEVVAHLVHVAALAAEIDLHVDDDERRIRRPQVAIEGPRVGIGSDRHFFHEIHFTMLSSPGAPASVRFVEQVAIMMPSVSTYGAALNR